MCGIVGKVNFNGEPVEKSLLKRMADTIVYRGPDDEGYYSAPYIGLGQRRLAIIDLRSAAAPPLSNEDGSAWVVFNGEIYNFKELRSELIEKGHKFRTASDTEVIVHLYEEYGVECLHRMRGMFAFAIWDAKNKLLFAARDRVGKKPFNYTKTRSSFVFGSEIKAITADPTIRRTPDYSALDSYLRWQYVPSPRTAFAGISKLPPGHYLTCDVEGNLNICQYWSPPCSTKTSLPKEEIEQELLRILRESIRLRMVSDVPIGAFLSGGIDSGTTVALMAMESSAPIKTFSIGFEEEKFNELPFAKMLAERYGTEHHEFTVRPSAADVLPLLVHHYNEPFADPSALPTYYVSKMTRQHVTVAISGDGGDESFAGYVHYRKVMQWAKFDGIPATLRSAIFNSMDALTPAGHHVNAVAKMSKALRMAGAQLPDRYRQYMSILKDQERDYLYTDHFRHLAGESLPVQVVEELPWHEDMDSIDWMMRHDQSHYLPDCLMVKTDIASMANSLEVRCPLLDHHMIEFAATIPSHMKVNSSGGKAILKSAVKDLLPESTFNKPKTGFGVPVSAWFRGDLAPFLKDILLSESAEKRELFHQKQVHRMVEEQLSGARDWGNRLWAFLILELWFREFID
jgi:asparagine synthase (glutamine-hydrolysing)